MVVQTADEAMSNAAATTSCSVGMCLWQTQEWLESPHAYPDASSQWRAAKYQHPGDRTPPEGAPVFWTGGGSGYGHATVSMGGGMVRSTDQQSNGKCATVSIDEIDRDWSNLNYEGWTEDIADVRLSYLSAGGKPDNPNGVKVGDTVLVIASGELNGRAEPDPDADVVTTRPYGDSFVVGALTDGWAGE